MSAYSQLTLNKDLLEDRILKQLAVMGSEQLMYSRYIVGKEPSPNDFLNLSRLNRILNYSSCYSDLDTKCLKEIIYKLT